MLIYLLNKCEYLFGLIVEFVSVAVDRFENAYFAAVFIREVGRVDFYDYKL